MRAVNRWTLLAAGAVAIGVIAISLLRGGPLSTTRGSGVSESPQGRKTRVDTPEGAASPTEANAAALMPARELLLNVVDAETDAPIASASVEAGEGDERMSIEGLGNGAFRIRGAPGAHAVLRASAPEYTPGTVAVSLVERMPVRLSLVREGPLRVIVASTDGGRIAGAKVRLSDAGSSVPVAGPATGTSGAGGGADEASIVSDDRGEAVFARVRRAGDHLLRVEAEDHAPLSVRIPGRTSQIAVQLLRAVVVKVAVRDRLGSPVPRARVVSFHIDGRVLAQAETDVAGEAALAGAQVLHASNGFRLLVSAQGKAPVAHAGTWPPDGAPVVITLPDGAEGGVTIRSGDAAIPGVPVLFRALLPFRVGSEARLVDMSVSTGEDGRARLVPVAGAVYLVSLEDRFVDGGPRTFTGEELASFPEVRVAPGRVVVVRTMTPDGATVPGARIEAAVDMRAGLDRLAALGWRPHKGFVGIGVSAADGSARCEAPVDQGLSVVARAAGHAEGFARVGASDTEVLVTMERLRPFVVEVRDQFGEPARAVEVSVKYIDERRKVGTGFFSAETRALTGATGEATFELPLNFKAAVSAVSDGFTLWEQLIPEEALRAGRLTVQVQAAHWVTIRVVGDDGSPLRNMPLNVHVQGQAPPPSGPAVTDADGMAQIPLPKVAEREHAPSQPAIVRIRGSGEYDGLVEVDAAALADGATITLSRVAKRSARFVVSATPDLAVGTVLSYSVVEQGNRYPLAWGLAKIGEEVAVSLSRDVACDLVVSAPDRMAFSVRLAASTEPIRITPPRGRTIRVANHGPGPEVVSLDQLKPYGWHWQSPLLRPGGATSVWIQADAVYVVRRELSPPQDADRRLDFGGERVSEVSLADGRIAIH